MESLCLSFGMGRELACIALEEALQCKQYTILEETPVNPPRVCIHTDETVFPDPWSFRPERWFGKEGIERRTYLLSLNKGIPQCVEINLACVEILLPPKIAISYE